MPPKKAKPGAKATPAQAKAEDAPATVTNAKGKEFETTAAAGRPRRASHAAEAAAPVTKAPVKKGTATPTSGKRGRPAKAAAEDEAEPPATRGRPAKAAAEDAPPAAKKRGRPAKAAAEDEAEPPAKRGRPAKTATEEAPPAAKKRGRPAKKAAPAVVDEEEHVEEEKAAPKKRGRPPKGGETTKITADDGAAAEQLEEELVDAAADEDTEAPSKLTSPTKKRGRPAKAKGKGKQVEVEVEDTAAIAEETDEDETAEAASGKRFWLMKAEQEDREEPLKDGGVYNTKFTIDDLRQKGGPEPWDGVRNATACKNMKDMKVGDLAFFYASGGKQGRAPGITGIMEVVKEAEPDVSAFDENSLYFSEKGTKDKPRWFLVHVEFRKKLSSPVTLKELQKYSQGDGVLSNMQQFKSARLSVSKVSEQEWDFIVNKLIEGYEEDAGALPGAMETNGIAKTDDDKAVNDAVNGAVTASESMLALPSVESDIPSTDTLLPADTAATSSKPVSRAGSLAPTKRAGSRARSRTPLSRAITPKPATTIAEGMEVIEE